MKYALEGDSSASCADASGEALDSVRVLIVILIFDCILNSNLLIRFRFEVIEPIFVLYFSQRICNKAYFPFQRLITIRMQNLSIIKYYRFPLFMYALFFNVLQKNLVNLDNKCLLEDFSTIKFSTTIESNNFKFHSSTNFHHSI